MANRDAIRAALQALAPEALERLAELMRHAEHERIRLEAIRLILEYGGHKAAAQHDVRLSVDHSHAHVLTVQEAWARRKARLQATGAEQIDGRRRQRALPVGPARGYRRRVLGAHGSNGRRSCGVPTPPPGCER